MGRQEEKGGFVQKRSLVLMGICTRQKLGKPYQTKEKKAKSSEWTC
jgi:hypothetical protein